MHGNTKIKFPRSVVKTGGESQQVAKGFLLHFPRSVYRRWVNWWRLSSKPRGIWRCVDRGGGDFDRKMYSTEYKQSLFLCISSTPQPTPNPHDSHFWRVRKENTAWTCLLTENLPCRCVALWRLIIIIIIESIVPFKEHRLSMSPFHFCLSAAKNLS